MHLVGFSIRKYLIYFFSSIVVLTPTGQLWTCATISVSERYSSTAALTVNPRWMCLILCDIIGLYWLAAVGSQHTGSPATSSNDICL